VNKEQEKIWKEACEEAEISTGYLPAELLLLPMLIKMVEDNHLGRKTGKGFYDYNSK